MSPGRFDVCLAETLRWEGGWSDDPHDPGGPTNRGITLAVYAAHMRKPLTAETSAAMVTELRAIPPVVVADIYRRRYWDMLRGDELPPGLDMAVFDYGVNSGITQATRDLQRVLGVDADGHMGAITLAKAKDCDRGVVVAALMGRRRLLLRNLGTFWRFGKGWLRRCDGVEAACRASLAPLALPSDWDTTASLPPAPLPDADAQSASQGKAASPRTESMGQSSTARAAEAAGGLSGVQLGTEIAGAASRARGPAGIDWLALALALAQSPTFWLAAGVVATSAYVWLERRRRIITGG